MVEYIKKDMALVLVVNELDLTDEQWYRVSSAFVVEPPADVMPIVHGEWIGVEGDGYAEDENGEMQIVYDIFECSNCGCEHHADGEPEWAYCPDCGAKMDLKSSRVYEVEKVIRG